MGPPKPHRPILLFRSLAVVGAMALLAGACGDDGFDPEGDFVGPVDESEGAADRVTDGLQGQTFTGEVDGIETTVVVEPAASPVVDDFEEVRPDDIPRPTYGRVNLEGADDDVERRTVTVDADRTGIELTDACAELATWDVTDPDLLAGFDCGPEPPTAGYWVLGPPVVGPVESARVGGVELGRLEDGVPDEVEG